jgi:hypothetical protein
MRRTQIHTTTLHAHVKWADNEVERREVALPTIEADLFQSSTSPMVLVLRIVVWMLRTDLPTLIYSAGVLNAPALARVFRSTEISLIFIKRVLPKSYDKARKYSRSK